MKYSPLFTTAAIVIVTALINVGLAYTGTTQKLSCTMEQTAAVASAIMALPPNN